jgi:UDP-N-acetylmuramate--alanine ligase
MLDTVDNYKKIYFIGIGGISMSGLAEILHSKNHEISGSDSMSSDLTDHLIELGIKVFIGQNYSNVPTDVDLVVHTAAVKESNPEIISSKDKNLKIVDRAYLLGMIMKDYKYPICISGTHGKTTTTSMMSEVLLAANKNPTIMIGGILNSIGKNYNIGSNEYFAVESCEYFDSFTKFYPHTGIVLNVDKDHLDYFKDLSHIEKSFNKFCKNINEDGVLVINNKIKNLENIICNLNCPVITYGDVNSDYYATNIVLDELGVPQFDVIYRNENICTLKLGVRGMHNVDNSLSVFAACRNLNIEIEHISKGLLNFKGVNRRYEEKGKKNGVTIIDDYAHHPTEIIATLNTAKNTKGINKIYAIFQPHTYSRTLSLFEDFANSFELADDVIILDIYSARETDANKVHSKDLVLKINENGLKAQYFSSFLQAEEYLLSKIISNDLVITMGAGDVYLLGENILSTK